MTVGRIHCYFSKVLFIPKTIFLVQKGSLKDTNASQQRIRTTYKLAWRKLFTTLSERSTLLLTSLLVLMRKLNRDAAKALAAAHANMEA